MKQYLLLTLAVCCMVESKAQSILTGKISEPKGEQIELNITRDVWYQTANSVYTDLKPDGSFSFTVPGDAPLFVTLRYNQQAQKLLLSPGRPLHLTFDNTDLPGTIKFSGKAAAENMLVHASFPARPFFTKEFSSKNVYGKMSGDSLLQVLLPGILKEADSLSLNVTKTRLPASLTSKLRKEIKYYYALNMDEFYIVLQSYTRNPAANLWMDTTMKITGIPSMEDLNSSPSANYSLQAYAKNSMATIARVYKKDKDKGTKMLEAAVGLPFDSMTKLAREYGDEIIGMLMAEKVLPPAQYERLLANRILYYSNEKELSMSRKLLLELNKHFANGTEAKVCSERIARLETMLVAGKANSHIVIRKDYASITTLEQLLAPYKGKLVYLDIWGTWCGPCLAEMRYTPKLKEKMKGKDIVFLYLSNDSDLADKKWREFVQVNHITGEHVRITGKTIEGIWQTLLPDEEARQYPTFFIFDKEGKMLVKKAKRPSDEEALYSQLLGFTQQ